MGAIESQAAIYTGKLVALSEQQAVDCAYLDSKRLFLTVLKIDLSYLETQIAQVWKSSISLFT